MINLKKTRGSIDFFMAAPFLFFGGMGLAVGCEYEITAAPGEEGGVVFEIKNTSENEISLKLNEIPWKSSNSMVSALIGANSHFEAKRIYYLSENTFPTPPLTLENNGSVNGAIDVRELFDMEGARISEDGIFLWYFKAKDGCSFGGAVEVGHIFTPQKRLFGQ